MTELTVSAPFVVDSDSMLANPEVIIRKWCSAVGLDFLPNVLTWSEGSSIETGSYDDAPWHKTLSASTGFTRRGKSKTEATLPAEVEKVHKEVLPHYKHMLAARGC